MRIKRRKCREIKIGNVTIGGNHPIVVQSMVKTATSDLSATLRQIRQLQNLGCQLVRLAIKNDKDAIALRQIKRKIKIPLIADIHFDKNLAIKAIESGVDKIRLNPGNIYKKNEIKEIVKAAKQARIPIRVGVNSGSAVPSLHSTAGKQRNPAKLMVKCALNYIKLLEGFGFYDIVVSIKGSDILTTMQANERIAKSCDYPLHLGITATGPGFMGMIKSAIVIGGLFSRGIGDTIRISLTDRATQEVRAAFYILEALGLLSYRPQIISCPTCGRCEVDLVKIVKELDKRITDSIVYSPQSIDKSYRLSRVDYRLPPKVAIMGCVVNGPGEARAADVGVAFGKKEGLLFKKGQPIRKISSQKCVDVLLKELMVISHKS